MTVNSSNVKLHITFRRPPKANRAFGEIKSGWILTMIVSYFHAVFMEQCSNCILDCNTVIYDKYLFISDCFQIMVIFTALYLR